MSEHDIGRQFRDEIVTAIADFLMRSHPDASVIAGETATGSPAIRIAIGDHAVNITVTKARR